MKKVAASKDELDAFKIAMEMEKEGETFYRKSLEAGQNGQGEGPVHEADRGRAAALRDLCEHLQPSLRYG